MNRERRNRERCGEYQKKWCRKYRGGDCQYGEHRKEVTQDDKQRDKMKEIVDKLVARFGSLSEKNAKDKYNEILRYLFYKRIFKLKPDIAGRFRKENIILELWGIIIESNWRKTIQTKRSSVRSSYSNTGRNGRSVKENERNKDDD